MKNKSYFFFTIFLGVVLALLYFLINYNDKPKLQNEDYLTVNNESSIIFTNKHNIPLLNKTIIPEPILVDNEAIGLSIKEVLVRMNFSLANFEPVNKNTMNKKFRETVTIELIPLPYYIRWYARDKITVKLLEQVEIPELLCEKIIQILNVKTSNNDQVHMELQKYLSGTYLKYFNIIRLFCVF